MAYDVTDLTYAQRKVKIDRMKIYVKELEAINEAARKLELEMLDAGVIGSEVKTTVDKMLSAGGPPWTAVGEDTDIVECTGDTISDRLVNMVSSNDGFTGWGLTEPT